MYFRSFKALIFAATLFGIGKIAKADVIEFDMVKIEVYEQDSEAEPTAPIQFLFNAFVEADPGDAGMISIGGSANQLEEIEPGLWEFVDVFTDPFVFDGTYPNGATYQLNLNSGSLGTQIETMSFPPENFPNVPAFTPASFLAMQGADPYLELTLEWIDPNVDTNLIVLSIYDPIADDYIVDEEFESGTSFTIPSGLLAPGRAYEVELIFAQVEFGVGDDGVGFGSSAEKLEGFANLTLTTLTTAAGEVFLDAGVFKGVVYEQTANDTPPSGAIEWSFEAFFDAGPGGMSEGEVVGGLIPAELVESSSSPGAWDTDDKLVSFSSRSELDSFFPSDTVYTMQIGGGSLGGRAQPFFIGPDAYPAPGYLLGNLVGVLNSSDFIDEDITLTWSTPDASVDYVAIFIDRLTSQGAFADTVIDSIFPASQTEFVIPAGTLSLAGEYELGLTFVNGNARSADQHPGFGSSRLIADGYLTDTLVFFSPRGTGVAADLNGDGVCNFFDVSAFLVAYQAQDPIADFTDDGLINFFDVSAFLVSFQTDC
jgi:hypothetical protein